MFERDKMQVDCEKALKDLEVAKQQIGVGGNKNTNNKDGDQVCTLYYNVYIMYAHTLHCVCVNALYINRWCNVSQCMYGLMCIVSLLGAT